jgi:NADH dehydrogenase [ubiquinone] 1 alpha subcomplex assembly factor 5
VTDGPFSERRRALVRDRAARIGPDLFLLDRVFEDALERLNAINRPLDKLLLVGCPSPRWLAELSLRFESIVVIEPGPAFAAACGSRPTSEIEARIEENCFDAALAIGSLDTVNQLPLALRMIVHGLRANAPLVGAMAGGNSLPALRSALIEGERSEGAIAQRVHPRLDAPTLAGLLAHAGFSEPIVDVDRVTLRYPSFASLVRDLRAMGATSQLARVAPLKRGAAKRAASAFESAATDGKTAETIEILHFAGWTSKLRQTPR